MHRGVIMCFMWLRKAMTIRDGNMTTSLGRWLEKFRLTHGGILNRTSHGTLLMVGISLDKADIYNHECPSFSLAESENWFDFGHLCLSLPFMFRPIKTIK